MQIVNKRSTSKIAINGRRHRKARTGIGADGSSHGLPCCVHKRLVHFDQQVGVLVALLLTVEY